MYFVALVKYHDVALHIITKRGKRCQVDNGTLAAPMLNKEHNGGKSSCYQTTAGHHALTEFNPFFPPTEREQGGWIGKQKRRGMVMLRSCVYKNGRRNKISIAKYQTHCSYLGTALAITCCQMDQSIRMSHQLVSISYFYAYY